MTLPPLTASPFDQQLLERLRPASWRNPETDRRYHLLVVGGGTAGLVTAAIAAGLGARVALLERGLMGGDCLNVGCVPSKALLAAARSWRAARDCAARFAGPAVAGGGDFDGVLERMRRLRAEISVHDSPERFEGLGVDVWLGEARFAGLDTVEVDGRTLRFRRAVVATGTRPYVPRIPGLAEAGFHTNETIFSITELPARLVVIGAGAIGVEMAQAFATFGSQVVVLEAADRVLGTDDPDAAAVVGGALERAGVRVHCGARIRGVSARERSARSVRAEVAGGGTVEVECDEILLACGRAANVEGLELERAGVEISSSGVAVDERLRTANPRIYAAGDVVGPLRFTHLADAHARLVVRNALFFGRGRASDLVVPWCTYTSPELAHVGRPYPELLERAAELDEVTIPFAEVDRAKLDGETEGFLRIHVGTGSDRIVAATAVGADAGELIGYLSDLMRAGRGLGSLGDTVFPYPTRAEVLRKAGDAWRRTRLTPRVGRAFSRYFAVLGRR